MKQNISIKGSKDGLIFFLKDSCSFDEIVSELRDKLENSHNGILSGPLMRVSLKTGQRKLTLEQEEQIRDIFKAKGNLFIHSIENDLDQLELENKKQAKVITGVVRSGQVHEFEGNILFIGDINPGGLIRTSGHIYILGSLKGIAHAGAEGDRNAIVAASQFEPMQIRIADVIHEFSPDKENASLFAYLSKDEIIFEKLAHVHKYRKDLGILLHV